jgi:hypothetical protein
MLDPTQLELLTKQGCQDLRSLGYERLTRQRSWGNTGAFGCVVGVRPGLARVGCFRASLFSYQSIESAREHSNEIW